MSCNSGLSAANGDRVWVCGQVTAQTSEGIVWLVQGVFLTREEALTACRDASYFVGPVVLGQILLHEAIDWPECEYPGRQK